MCAGQAWHLNTNGGQELAPFWLLECLNIIRGRAGSRLTVAISTQAFGVFRTWHQLFSFLSSWTLGEGNEQLDVINNCTHLLNHMHLRTIKPNAHTEHHYETSAISLLMHNRRDNASDCF